MGSVRRPGETSDAAIATQLIADVLENAVSAFDGFGREVCRVAAQRSPDPSKAVDLISEHRGSGQRLRDLFGIDIAAALTPDEWIFRNPRQ